MSLSEAADCAANDDDSDELDLDRMDDEESLLCTAASEVHKKWEGAAGPSLTHRTSGKVPNFVKAPNEWKKYSLENV